MRLAPDSRGEVRVRLAAAAVLLLAVLLGLASMTIRTPADSQPRASRAVSRSPATAPLRPAPGSPSAPSTAPAPAVAPLVDEPHTLTFQCAVPSGIADGPVRFVALERYAPVATDLRVTRGLLEGSSSDPGGEGDLMRGPDPIGRLTWSEGEAGEASCEVTAIPTAAIVGRVLDAAGSGVAAVISGCGQTVEADADGSYSLTVPTGRSCRLRALVRGARVRTATGEATAPATLDLELEAPRELEELRTDIDRAHATLGAMYAAQKQLAAAVPDAGPGAADALERTRSRLEALEGVLVEDADRDELLDAWLSLDAPR